MPAGAYGFDVCLVGQRLAIFAVQVPYRVCRVLARRVVGQRNDLLDPLVLGAVCE